MSRRRLQTILLALLLALWAERSRGTRRVGAVGLAGLAAAAACNTKETAVLLLPISLTWLSLGAGWNTAGRSTSFRRADSGGQRRISPMSRSGPTARRDPSTANASTKVTSPSHVPTASRSSSIHRNASKAPAPRRLQASPARTMDDVRRVSGQRPVDIVATFLSQGIRPRALPRGRSLREL